MKLLQGRSPFFSTEDREFIRQQLEAGEIFSSMSREAREGVLSRITQVKCIIPSIYTFQQDSLFLEPCFLVLRHLLPPKYKGTIPQGLLDRYTPAPDDQIVWQTGENDFRVTPNKSSKDFASWSGICQLALLSLRNYPYMTALKPRKRKRRPRLWNERDSAGCWLLLANTALRLGFSASAPEIWLTSTDNLNLQNYKTLYSRNIQPVAGSVDYETLQHKVESIVSGFQQPANGTPEMTKDGHEDWRLDFRCGRSFEEAYDADYPSLFLNKLTTEEPVPKKYISSIMVALDIFRAFFGSGPESPPNLDQDTEMADVGAGNRPQVLSEPRTRPLPAAVDAPLTRPHSSLTVTHEVSRGRVVDAHIFQGGNNATQSQHGVILSTAQRSFTLHASEHGVGSSSDSAAATTIQSQHGVISSADQSSFTPLHDSARGGGSSSDGIDIHPELQQVHTQEATNAPPPVEQRSSGQTIFPGLAERGQSPPIPLNNSATQRNERQTIFPGDSLPEERPEEANTLTDTLQRLSKDADRLPNEITVNLEENRRNMTKRKLSPPQFETVPPVSAPFTRSGQLHGRKRRFQNYDFWIVDILTGMHQIGTAIKISNLDIPIGEFLVYLDAFREDFQWKKYVPSCLIERNHEEYTCFFYSKTEQSQSELMDRLETALQSSARLATPDLDLGRWIFLRPADCEKKIKESIPILITQSHGNEIFFEDTQVDRLVLPFWDHDKRWKALRITKGESEGFIGNQGSKRVRGIKFKSSTTETTTPAIPDDDEEEL